MSNDGWQATIWAALISLAAAALGVLIRYAHIAQQDEINWWKLRLEVPTVVGMAIIAVPVSEYLTSTFGIHQGVVAAVCVCLGYLGPSSLMLLGSWLTGKKSNGSKGS